MDSISQYKGDLYESLESLSDEHITEAAAAILHCKGTVYTCGNGGSAATASHMVCDLTKNTGQAIKTYCINDNVPIFSAYANDEDYRNVFAAQLFKWMTSEDVLVAITTSGESQNIIDAIEVAKMNEAHVILLTGNRWHSSCAILLSDYDRATMLFVRSDNIGVVEDCHLVINHILTEIIREMA